MPQEGQRTVTLNERDVSMIDPIAEKEKRSVSSIVKLCILAQFGSKQEQREALELLERMK